MSPIGAVHLASSPRAVLLGALVTMLPKGTRWHRTWGHGYVWCMAGVVATSLSLYRLTGSVTLFHVAAAVAGGTVLAGMWSVLRRRPNKTWIRVHATWMAWSYVGLLAALVAESLSRFAMPALEEVLDRSALWPAFWTVVALGSAATFGAGAWVVRRRLSGAVAAAPAAMRLEREELREAE